MSKFCRNCGTKIIENKKFCHNCGTIILKMDTTELLENAELKKTLYEKLIVNKKVVICIVFVFVVGGIFYKDSEWASKHIEFLKSYFAVVSVKDITAEAQVLEMLRRNNIEAEVIATTLGHNKNGSLSLMKNGDSYKFIIIDNRSNKIAEVQDEVNNRGKDCVIFKFLIYNDEKDKDNNHGVWYDKNHLMPVYAFFDVDVNNNIIPGMLYTSSGANPSRYHDYLLEQKNVDIANLFLTEMPILNKLCSDKNVNWPLFSKI